MHAKIGKIRDKVTGEELTCREGSMYLARTGDLVEFYDGRWRRVVNGNRAGWWRYHDHRDRDGYCDNPGRGY